MTPRRPLLLGCLASAIIALGAPVEGAEMNPKRLAGRYDGGQTEIAAGLELRADGRFRYALSYGALDEEAEGRWTYDGSRVVLTSGPVAAPKFVLVAAKPSQEASLKVTLDLPQGMNRQYFKARIELSDGRSIERQFADDGLDVPLAAGERAVSVALRLPVLGLEGEPAPLPAASGGEAHFRFDPNDLGKVGFEGEGLTVAPDGLRLQRHDRTILFRRVADP